MDRRLLVRPRFEVSGWFDESMTSPRHASATGAEGCPRMSDSAPPTAERPRTGCAGLVALTQVRPWTELARNVALMSVLLWVFAYHRVVR